MGSGFAKKKKEAKMFKESMAEMQEKMKSTTATGTSGGGLVTIILNGEHEVKEIKIKPECVDPEDVDGLEDLIKVAFNDATKKLMKESTGDLSGMAGAFGGFNPFG